jgi:hypothetical protein
MEPKTLLQKIAPFLWAAGGLLAILIVVGMFVDYPTWLEHLIINILMIGLGLVMLLNAYRIRKIDRKFSMIYLIVGLTLIVLALLSKKWILIGAAVGLVIFLLTNRRVQKIISQPEEKENQ